MQRMAGMAITGFAFILMGAPTLKGQCGSWSPPLNLSNDTGRFATDPYLAVESAHKVHCLYQDFLDASGQNFYTTNASGFWSPPQPLGSMGSKGSAPRIVITPDEQLHAFFGRGTLQYRTKPVNGGAWSAAVNATEFGTGDFIESITVDSTGGIYLMYGHLFDASAPVRNGVYGRYKPLGGAWQATELIYGNSNDGNWPLGHQVVANGNTLWMTLDVDDDMYFKKKTIGGVWPAGKGTLFNEPGAGLRFAFSPTSNEIAAMWANDLPCDGACEDDPWFETYLKFSTNDGANWGSTFNISSQLDDIDRKPSGKYDTNGNLHIVWEGFCCDHKVRMRYRGRVGGVWGPIVQISSGVGEYTPDVLQVDGLNLYAAFMNNGTGVGLIDAMYTSLEVNAPRINLSQQNIEHTIYIGSAMSNQPFTVSNGCLPTLNYSITDNADWLSETPDSGTSDLDLDTITIAYDGASTLHRGVHNAAITVAGNASNNPQVLNVKVTVNSVKPDFDGDGDVDQSDFGHLQLCYTGSAVPQMLPACLDTRLDGDEDVDLNDFGVFQGCISGANHIADANCAN